jgi:transcriptional regulator with XRE-family HTH domain
MGKTPTDTAPPRRTRYCGPTRQVGAAIRALREKDCWPSQEAFARAVGMTQANLSRIENEDVNARLSTLNKIARGLGVPVRAILRDDIDGAAA